MSMKGFNRFFESLQNEIPTYQNLTKRDELDQELHRVATDLGMRQVMNLKQYEIAFQEAIERIFPDKLWWEVTDCDIFLELFNTRDIQGTIRCILNNLKPEYQDGSILGESISSEVVKDAVNYYKENAFAYDDIEDYVRVDFSDYPRDKQNELILKIHKALEEKLSEDTVKTTKGKWVNKGDTGKTHGEFETKKQADAQRRAMFASGFKK